MTTASLARLAALLLALAIAVTACRPLDPQSELESAVAATLADSFAYTVVVEGADAATTDIGLALRGLGIDGVRGDGLWSVRVTVLGFDVFELRTEDERTRHVHLGLGRVLALLAGPDVDPSEAIVDELEDRGVGEAALAVVEDGLRGEWITIEGSIDADELDAALGGDDLIADTDRESLIDVLGGDIGGFLDAYVVVRDVDGDRAERVFTVDIETGALARALSALDPRPGNAEEPPEAVPGTVVVRDGQITEVELRVGEDDGVRITLVVSDHGAANAVEAPPRPVVVSKEPFLEAVRALSDLFADVGMGLPGQ